MVELGIEEMRVGTCHAMNNGIMLLNLFWNAGDSNLG